MGKFESVGFTIRSGTNPLYKKIEVIKIVFHYNLRFYPVATEQLLILLQPL